MHKMPAQEAKELSILAIKQLGQIDYSTALVYQEELVELRHRNDIPDTLLLLEHPPVITIGKGGGRENILCGLDTLLKEGIQVYEVNRGGNVTYHGPGQLVGYPVLDLGRLGNDVHLYLRNLEEVVIQGLEPFLSSVELTATRIPGLTGVWVENQKIAAIGVGTRKWISMHGFAINVNTRLAHFNLINPCGIGKQVTSLAVLMKRPVDINAVSEQIATAFCKVFGYIDEARNPAAISTRPFS